MNIFLYRMLGLPVLFAFITVAVLPADHAETATEWQAKLARQLPLLGHRNWIVVADAAYPWQTASGIETLCTGADHLEVLQIVLANLDRAKHVRPIIFVDTELAHVPEYHAAGIGIYRTALARLLEGRTTTSLPHEQIIARMDKAGATFHVMLLKTNLKLPYTSVFIELDCGYWSAEAEQALRAAIRKTRP